MSIFISLSHDARNLLLTHPYSVIYTLHRASATNTPATITPENVSHSRGRNVKRNKSWEWRTPWFRKKRTPIVSISIYLCGLSHLISVFQYTYGPRPFSLELFNENHNAGRESLSHLISVFQYTYGPRSISLKLLNENHNAGRESLSHLISVFQYTVPMDHGHLARNCFIKIITPAVKALVFS